MSATLLNWDDTFSKEDLLANIKHEVHCFTGWKLLRVDLDENLLKIDAKDADGAKQLLVYDVRGFGREIYGRLAHVGLARFASELKLLA